VLPVNLDGSQTVSVSYTPNPNLLLPRLKGRYDQLEAAGFEDQVITYFVPVNTASVSNGNELTTLSADGLSAADPMATTVSSPNTGQLSISEEPLTAQTSNGYTFFGQQVLITAPSASDPTDPLLLTFDLDPSVVPDGETAQSITILRNDVPVAECDAIAPSAAVASPPTCVWRRVDHTDGGITITVAALQASRWNFAVIPPYAFGGFKSPVDKAPIRNGMKAGTAVPLRFSLGGNRGLAIFDSGSPSSQQIACDGSAWYDGVEETVGAGASSLSYDATSDTYTYIWKTQKAWTGCRRLTLAFADGSVQEAIFQFKP
jgi:hypothetical protein